MEAFDVVVHKTVKDLFKSNNLTHILKYKINKEKELISKDDDMKKLILEKYPFLIKSLANLEEISSNIPALEELRKGFEQKVEMLKEIDSNENLFHLDEVNSNDYIYDMFLFDNELSENKKDEVD